jgi:hypothetical protein
MPWWLLGALGFWGAKRSAPSEADVPRVKTPPPGALSVTITEEQVEFEGRESVGKFWRKGRAPAAALAGLVQEIWIEGESSPTDNH